MRNNGIRGTTPIAPASTAFQAFDDGQAILDALTSEGTIATTAAMLSDDHAAEIASDIFALATWAQQEYLGARAIRDATDKQLVDEAMRRAGLR